MDQKPSTRSSARPRSSSSACSPRPSSVCSRAGSAPTSRATQSLLRQVARGPRGAQRRAHEGHPRRRRHRLLVLVEPAGHGRGRDRHLAEGSGAGGARGRLDRNLVDWSRQHSPGQCRETSALVERTAATSAIRDRRRLVAAAAVLDTANQIAARATRPCAASSPCYPPRTPPRSARPSSTAGPHEARHRRVGHLERTVDSVDGRRSWRACRCSSSAATPNRSRERRCARHAGAGEPARDHRLDGAATSRHLAHCRCLRGAARQRDIELRATGQQLRATAAALGTTARKFNDPRAALLARPSTTRPGRGEAMSPALAIVALMLAAAPALARGAVSLLTSRRACRDRSGHAPRRRRRSTRRSSSADGRRPVLRPQERPSARPRASAPTTSSAAGPSPPTPR